MGALLVHLSNNQTQFAIVRAHCKNTVSLHMPNINGVRPNIILTRVWETSAVAGRMHSKGHTTDLDTSTYLVIQDDAHMRAKQMPAWVNS